MKSWNAVLICLFVFKLTRAAPMCNVDNNSKIDCYPESTPLIKEHCEQRGCCYQSYVKDENTPWCFYPIDYPAYHLNKLSNTSYGYNGILTMNTTQKHPYGQRIPKLSLDVFLETKDRLRFRLRDLQNSRFEVPISTPNVGSATKDDPLYDLDIKIGKFDVLVKRKSTGTVIFNTTIGPLLYFDQYLQISTSIPSTFVYGLGERHEEPLVKAEWTRNVFWAHDQPPSAGVNLYGDHPMYLCIEKDGNSHGVFFLNSNAKEVETQPAPALTWRSIGGIMDLYILLGPTPESVIQQYTDVVGKPFLPPYWALGFHLCRWGYKSSNHTMEIVEEMRKANIPQDVQWNDIDYMESRLDFTYDPSKYGTLPQVVDNLHSHGQHYVMIIDPGISDTKSSYAPYDEGIAAGIFIKESDGKKPIEGLVWPGKTVFPDFTNPATESYWEKQLRRYHSDVPFDGVWIDMNEPSNFVGGSTSGCPHNNLEHPPYLPRIVGLYLSSRTLCASSLQYNNVTHYNLHSLTGLFEMKATSQALINMRGKRPFVISRSTFPSAGVYGGHWSGDIRSTWSDLRQSISSIVNFNIFGVPMVGADICGFGGNTNEELCIRWMQLGAFYPFSRNHNDILAKPQAPIDFSQEAREYMRSALLLRYSLLPYLYSLFFTSHVVGGTVARGLFLEFPQDSVALKISEQFMWGGGLLISPVLYEKSTSVHAYFPEGNWYSLVDNFGKPIQSSGQYEDLVAPISEIPLHIRGGYILPTQQPSTTTTKSRSNPISLLVALDKQGSAAGYLYWDDGDSLNTHKNGMYLQVSFLLQNNTLTSKVLNKAPGISLNLLDVFMFGASPDIAAVYLNGKSIVFDRSVYGVLHFGCAVSLTTPFQVELKSK